MHALAWSVLMLTQASQASVVGTVRDATTGRILSGAEVVVSEMERRAVTDRSGAYVLHPVPAGPRHIEVRSTGYEPLLIHALVPAAGRLQVDADLLPLPVVMSPIVVRSPEARGAWESPGDRADPATELHRHPGLAEPDVLAAVASTARGQAGLEAPAGLGIAGATPDQTAYTLDGLPVFNPVHGMGVFGSWNPDAVGAVRLRSRPTATSVGGLLAVETRAPGTVVRSEGSASTRQARVRVGGPLGSGGMGYVVSLRAGTIGSIAPSDETSYLQGGMEEWLVRFDTPALAGTLSLLASGSSDRARAAAEVSDRAPSALHDFEWEGGLTGFRWRRSSSRGSVEVRGWASGAEAEADWRRPGDPVRLAADRREMGLSADAGMAHLGGRTRTGLTVEAPRTAYVTTLASGDRGLDLRSQGLRTRLRLGHARRIAPRLTIDAEAGLTLPTAEPSGAVLLDFELSNAAAVSFELSRGVQAAQSLRNVESVVGAVFPAELFVGAGAPGVPAATASQVRLGARISPAPGLRLEATFHASRHRDILFVSPVEGSPFAVRNFGTGDARTHGVAIDGDYATGRWRLQASYAWLAVRRRFEGMTFTPGYVPAHELHAATAYYPSPTWALRMAWTAALGRRGLPIDGEFEWETCNLLDRGCEFAGSPDYGTATPGSGRLPAYVRVDLGLRKHWHVRIGDRRATLEAFATVVNVIGRPNVLTYAGTGRSLAPVDLVPASPLVVGLDWRF